MIFRIFLTLTTLLGTSLGQASDTTKLTARVAIREIQKGLFNGEARLEGISDQRNPCVMAVETLEGRFPGISVMISEANRAPVAVEITSPNAAVERTRNKYLTKYQIRNQAEDNPAWIFIQGYEDIGNFDLTVIDSKANSRTCLFTE